MSMMVICDASDVVGMIEEYQGCKSNAPLNTKLTCIYLRRVSDCIS